MEVHGSIAFDSEEYKTADSSFEDESSNVPVAPPPSPKQKSTQPFSELEEQVLAWLRQHNRSAIPTGSVERVVKRILRSPYHETNTTMAVLTLLKIKGHVTTRNFENDRQMWVTQAKSPV